MRYFGPASLVALSLVALQPSSAAAQQAGTPMGDLMDLNRFATRGVWNQWMATRPTHLSGMSPAATEWLKEQVQLQAEAPRPVPDVAAAVDETLGDAIREAAKNEGVRPDDVSQAIVLRIMLDTKSALAREARRVKGVAEPGKPSWDERIARADADRKAAMELQSTASMALASD